MKARKLIIALFAIQLLSAVQLSAEEKKPAVLMQQEQALQVKLDDLYGEKVVKVSFNAENMGTGKLSVVDTKGNLVYYAEEFDLVAAPYFNSISVSQLSAGELTFTVVTKVGSYKAVIIL